MKKFRSYIIDTEEEHKYRIKLAVPISEEKYNRLFNFFKKYDVKEISPIRKTILQTRPLDFGDLLNVEIYIIDVTLGIPVSQYVLQQELSTLFELSEKYIVVRNIYEGMEQLTLNMDINNEAENIAKENNLQKSSYLSTRNDYLELETQLTGEMLAGNKYNDEMKKSLANYARERKEYYYNTDSGLFKELMKVYGKNNLDDYGENNFNNIVDDYNSIPKVYSKWHSDENLPDEDLENASREVKSRWGNFWTGKTFSKPYKNEKNEYFEIGVSTDNILKVKSKFKNGK